MSERLDVRTVALVCPECQSRLRAPPGDVVFFCERCRQVSEAHDGRLALRELVTLDAGGTPGVVRLPVWRFGVAVAYSGEPDVVEGLERAARPDRVFVAAFRQRNAMAFGDMGMLLTAKPPTLVESDPEPFSGAALRSAEAARLIEPMVLARADRVRDVTGVEVEVSVESVSLVTVPARDEGNALVDMALARRWPRAAFLDAEALRWRAPEPAGTAPA
jgi:hypothetical protein